MTEKEQSQLKSFRRAAYQIREASIVAHGERVQISFRRAGPGHVDVNVKLLGNEPFRSLALAIRLVYQQREPANFGSVANILARHAPTELRERAATIRAAYNEALRHEAGAVAIDDGKVPSILSTNEVFDAWLYGIAFHQDPQREPTVRRLATAGARFLWSVQATSLQLAGRILDLDDVIADVLNEERLPRLSPASEPPNAAL